jgi:hypothetical protein
MHKSIERPKIMSEHPVSDTPMNTRKYAAEEVNRAMARFPLIINILSEISRAQFPFPGDDDIRHGCERALTAILSELARIHPAPAGKSCKAEELAQAWLQNPEASRLIDADKLQRMQQFIDCTLNSARR